MVGQTEAKPELLEHLQHQVDILIKQESYIDAALKEIKKAQKEKWDVKLTEVKTLEQVFEDGEPGEDRSQAIEKAKLNGLTHMFVVTAKQPFTWKSIIVLAWLGIAQVAAGVLIFACTGGSVGLGVAQELEVREEKLDPYSDKKRKAIETGKRGDITNVALLAKTVKRPMIIYKGKKSLIL